MRYLSLFAGIEAATVAWQPLGWTPVAFSEIDPFACAVLTHHYPTIPNWGDIHDYKHWPTPPIDLLVGGPPCQAFSIAGARQGAADPRGTLLFTTLDVVRRYRPRWVVLENVPGLLSTHGGREFGAFLGALATCGYGFAYRILDAQYFGVPQRRRRVFIVAYLRDWRIAAQVLFERESLCGHLAPRGQAPQPLTAVTETSAAAGDRTHGIDCPASIAFSSGRSRTPAVVAATLNASTQQDIKTNTLIVTLRRAPHNCVSAQFGAEVTHTLCTSAGSSSRAYVLTRAPTANLAVRRLTPREYERLQGYPDDYTLIPYRGKLAADGPRYRALGNSMAVPVMRWIGERIAQMETLHPPTSLNPPVKP